MAASYSAGRKKRRKALSSGFWTFVMLSLPLSIILHATALVLVIGLAPTIVAYFMDRSDGKLAPITVGAINICGVMPFLLHLWTHNHSVHGAVQVISNPVAWLVMYAAAGIGWGFYYGIPPAVANFQVIRAESRIETLRKTQTDLVKEWGVEVAADEDGAIDLPPPPKEPPLLDAEEQQEPSEDEQGYEEM